jgi:hypothetical protein
MPVWFGSILTGVRNLRKRKTLSERESVRYALEANRLHVETYVSLDAGLARQIEQADKPGESV